LDIKSYWFTQARGLAGAGTQTAALAFGGGNIPPATGATEEYDGSTWTTRTGLNTARYNLGGAGTQTAALAFGGNTGSPLLQQQQKNTMVHLGTSPGSLNTARKL
jgi:hypothetical protein